MYNLLVWGQEKVIQQLLNDAQIEAKVKRYGESINIKFGSNSDKKKAIFEMKKRNISLIK